MTVRKKRKLFRIWSQTKKDRKKYYEVKKDAKRVVYMAMDQKAREEMENVDSCQDGCELFRIGK